MSFLLRPAICLIFLLSLAVSAVAGPQPFRVGVVFTSDNPYYQQIFDDLVDSLHQSGYPAEKLKLYIQRPNADHFSWANSVRRAESIGMDALVTLGTPTTRMALRETTGIPIVFSGVTSPLETPLERFRPVTTGSLRPIRGIYAQTPIATLIKTFSHPQSSGLITAVFHDQDPEFEFQASQMQQACELYGFKFQAKKLASNSFATSLQEAVQPNQVLLVSHGAFSKSQLRSIVEQGQKQQCRIIGYGYGLAQQGSLLSIEAAAAEQGEQAARQLITVLKGDPAKTLLALKPRKTDLIVNLPVAEQQGLRVPFVALTSASKVIR